MAFLPARPLAGRPGRCYAGRIDSVGSPSMTEAFICDAIRTPVGRYNGGLAAMRVDDLAAHPIKALMQRNANVDWGAVDDVIYGCVNQAGEDNRNVAPMACLLARLPGGAAGATSNRLARS